jgi:hypothetical protein
MPRRARHLIPTDLPRRGEVIAGFLLLFIVAHLLLAPLTMAIAAVFALVTRVTRWRLWWLAGPAAVGLLLVLLAGPRGAATGLAAGPEHVLRYLGGGQLGARLPRLPDVIAGTLFTGTGADGPTYSGLVHWVPGQLPLGLIAAAAEAVVIGWLAWLHTDEWAVPPARPGAVAALRTAIATRLIRAGAVLTRDGCALGTAAATGAVVSLSWAEAVGGVLVTGASRQEATVTSLQFAHAALRRRKPLIVLDLSGDASVGAAVAAACAATGVPLQVPGTGDALFDDAAVAMALTAASTATRVPLRMSGTGDTDFGGVIRARSAVLVRPASAAEARQACADIAALGRGLARIGADADGLIWICDADRLPVKTLTTLLPGGSAAGLATLFSTSAPAAGAELAGLVGATLTHRLADADCAQALASRTGTRWRPPGAARPLGTVRPPVPPGPPVPLVPDGRHELADSLADPDGRPVLVPSPAVPVRTLLSLGPGEFTLAVSTPCFRLVEFGRLVSARLPPSAAPAAAAGSATAGLPNARPLPVVGVIPAGGSVRSAGNPGLPAAEMPEIGWQGGRRGSSP